MTRTTPTCLSSLPPCWQRRRSTTAPATDLHQRRRHAPPAFHLLMRLSFRSRLAIWHSLCCALCAAHCLSTVALFQLKIASSGRGALAGTRWVHFNCNDKNPKGQPEQKPPRRSTSQQKHVRSVEKITTHNFFCALIGDHREQPRRRPQVGRPPDRLRHAMLELERQREGRRSHGPRSGGPIGCHLKKTKRPRPERYDTAGVVLPENFCQGNPSSSETL
jgi:hypothetical protein